MSTLRIKSDHKTLDVSVDGVNLVGLGISKIETKMEADKQPLACIEFDFADHDVDIDGCAVVVDGVRLPLSASVGITSKIAEHLVRRLTQSITRHVAPFQDARGTSEVTRIIEKELMLFVEDVAQGVKI